MPKRIVVMADEVTCTAFRLLGAETIAVNDHEEAIKVLNEIRMRDDVGVVLVAQHIIAPIKEEIENMASKIRTPIISFLPTKQMPGEPIDMRKLLMKALGFG